MNTKWTDIAIFNKGRKTYIYLIKRESHTLSRPHLVVPEILKIKQRMYFLLAVDEHFRLPIIHLFITLVAKLKIKVFVKKHIKSYFVSTNKDAESTLSSFEHYHHLSKMSTAYGPISTYSKSESKPLSLNLILGVTNRTSLTICPSNFHTFLVVSKKTICHIAPEKNHTLILMFSTGMRTSISLTYVLNTLLEHHLFCFMDFFEAKKLLVTTCTFILWKL